MTVTTKKKINLVSLDLNAIISILELLNTIDVFVIINQIELEIENNAVQSNSILLILSHGYRIK